MGIQQKKQLLKKVWDWIKITSLLLGIVCGSIFIYQWWTKRQKLEKLQALLKEYTELKDRVQREYQLQEKHSISLTSLENNPKIKGFFSDLLRNYSEKFAKSKDLDISQLPLKFEGLYYDENTGKEKGKMGYCSPRTIIYPYQVKEINIGINRLYLLNKFGHDKYFTSSPEKSNDYTYLDIGFDKMIETCSHELAHYIQLVKHSKSSCESDLVLKNGNYDERLAKEHEEWTKEAYQLIKENFPQLEQKWREIE